MYFFHEQTLWIGTEMSQRRHEDNKISRLEVPGVSQNDID